jgi:hypothetical protein
MEMSPAFLLTVLAIVLLLEGVLATLFLWMTRQPVRLVLWFFAANVISVFAAWLVLPNLFEFPLLLGYVFLASVVIEATALSIMLRKFFKPHVIIFLTIALNIFSTIVGLMVYLLVQP